MEPEQPCREQCKFQRDGKCTLERADYLVPVNGAACCEHLFEDEFPLHY